VNEFEEKMKGYLGVKHFFFVNNGTIALQIAIKALELKGEVITTPFSYVATTSSICWENCEPVFADISADDFTIDVNKIEALITPRTTGILATHVYGIPCKVKELEIISRRYGLKIIYDAAHAFGVKLNGLSILKEGDISTLSFHATKLFHTVEGGGILTNDDGLAHRISYMRNFGHKGQEDFWGIGINGKSSEFHAAMGLCLFPHIDELIANRKEFANVYDDNLKEVHDLLFRPSIPSEVKYNFAYYPILFQSEKQLLMVRDSLNAAYIYPRRYFYPSLNSLGYLKNQQTMEVSESVAKRVLCLPLYHDIGTDNVRRICNIIKEVLKF
jgi:dTDP-4-amino-4,6-dideoxygalactose transaminase